MSQLPKFNSFEEFTNWINENSDSPKLLYTKKSGKYCFGFRYEYNKVYYLINDGISVGKCRLENLHKVLYYN